MIINESPQFIRISLVFTQKPFPVPRPRQGHHITLSPLLLKFLDVTVSLVLMTLTVLSALVSFLQKVP